MTAFSREFHPRKLTLRLHKNERRTTWLDAQHPGTVIARRVGEQHVLHVGEDIAAMAATAAMVPHTLPTLQHIPLR